MVEVQLNVQILADKIRCETAIAKPCPEVCKIFENIDASMLRDEAIVRRDDYSIGSVDEWDKVGGKPGCIKAIACDLCMLA